jgi:hypothetical protein
MSAPISPQVRATDLLNSVLNRVIESVGGRPALGTERRKQYDLTQRNTTAALERDKPLTPQEQLRQNLEAIREIGATNNTLTAEAAERTVDTATRGLRNRTTIEDGSFGYRLPIVTDSRSRLQSEAADQARRNLEANYKGYGGEIMGPAFQLQRDLDAGSRELRGQIGNRLLDIQENAVNSDIAYRNQLLQMEQQQNSGLRGFLNNLVPIAGLGLTAAALFRG